MRRLLSVVAALTFMAALIGPAPALANNDPHRAFFPTAPFDLDTTFCPFPVHVDVPFQGEYARSSTLPDGSTVIKVTGPAFYLIRNVTNDKSVTVNGSSQGTFTIAPDGVSATGDFHGTSVLYAPNLTDYGFPSNVVAIAGAPLITQQFAEDGTFSFTSLTGHFQLLTDICAAIE